MPVVNIGDAKTHLSRLLEAAISGEEVIIAKRGKPVVRLTPIDQGHRIPGALRGKLHIDEQFFAPLPDEELDAWRQ